MLEDFYEENTYGSTGTCDAAAVPIIQLYLVEDSNPRPYSSND